MITLVSRLWWRWKFRAARRDGRDTVITLRIIWNHRHHNRYNSDITIYYFRELTKIYATRGHLNTERGQWADAAWQRLSGDEREDAKADHAHMFHSCDRS